MENANEGTSLSDICVTKSPPPGTKANSLQNGMRKKAPPKYGRALQVSGSSQLVRAGKEHPPAGRLSAYHTLAGLFGCIHGNTTNGRLGFVFNALLRFGCAIPVTKEKATLLIEQTLEFLVIVYLSRVGSSKIERLLVNIFLNIVEQLLYLGLDAFQRHNLLGKRIASRHFHRSVFEVSGTNSQSHRNPLQFVFGKFPTRLALVVVVVLHRNTQRFKTHHQSVHHLINAFEFLCLLVNRNKDRKAHV